MGPEPFLSGFPALPCRAFTDRRYATAFDNSVSVSFCTSGDSRPQMVLFHRVAIKQNELKRLSDLTFILLRLLCGSCGTLALPRVPCSGRGRRDRFRVDLPRP